LHQKVRTSASQETALPLISAKCPLTADAFCGRPLTSMPGWFYVAFTWPILWLSSVYPWRKIPRHSRERNW